MREIKFRGKRVDNGEWIEGDLLRINGHTFIFPDPAPKGIDKYKVDPETVGQYTGLKDKDGVEIYEGDIVVCQYGYCGSPNYPTHEEVVTVRYNSSGLHNIDSSDIFEIDVIGNIHNNSDLIKPKE